MWHRGKVGLEFVRACRIIIGREQPNEPVELNNREADGRGSPQQQLLVDNAEWRSLPARPRARFTLARGKPGRDPSLQSLGLHHLDGTAFLV